MASIDRQFDDNGDPIAAALPPQLSDSDLAEWNKMSQFTPTQAPSGDTVPWWQGAVLYGVTKAIDNTFPNDPRGIQGNTNPGSFAGANGRSYNQAGPLAQSPTLAGLGQSIAGMNPLVLIALAGLAVWAFAGAK